MREAPSPAPTACLPASLHLRSRPRPCLPDPLFLRLGAAGWGFPGEEVPLRHSEGKGLSLASPHHHLSIWVLLAPRPLPSRPDAPFPTPNPPARDLPLPGLLCPCARLPSHFSATSEVSGKRVGEAGVRGRRIHVAFASPRIPRDPPQRKGFPGAAAGQRARAPTVSLRSPRRPAPPRPPGQPGLVVRTQAPQLERRGHPSSRPGEANCKRTPPSSPHPASWAPPASPLQCERPRGLRRLYLPEYSSDCAQLNFLLGQRRRREKPGDRDAGGGEKLGRQSERRGRRTGPGGRAVQGLPQPRVAVQKAGPPRRPPPRRGRRSSARPPRPQLCGCAIAECHPRTPTLATPEGAPRKPGRKVGVHFPAEKWPRPGAVFSRLPGVPSGLSA